MTVPSPVLEHVPDSAGGHDVYRWSGQEFRVDLDFEPGTRTTLRVMTLGQDDDGNDGVADVVQVVLPAEGDTPAIDAETVRDLAAVLVSGEPDRAAMRDLAKRSPFGTGAGIRIGGKTLTLFDPLSEDALETDIETILLTRARVAFLDALPRDTGFVNGDGIYAIAEAEKVNQLFGTRFPEEIAEDADFILALEGGPGRRDILHGFRAAHAPRFDRETGALTGIGPAIDTEGRTTQHRDLDGAAFVMARLPAADRTVEDTGFHVRTALDGLGAENPAPESP